MEIMIRENPQLSLFINIAWICVDFRKTITHSQMLHDRLDKEEIRIAYDPQITTTKNNHSKQPYTNIFKQRKNEILRCSEEGDRYPKA